MTSQQKKLKLFKFTAHSSPKTSDWYLSIPKTETLPEAHRDREQAVSDSVRLSSLVMTSGHQNKTISLTHDENDVQLWI